MQKFILLGVFSLFASIAHAENINSKTVDNLIDSNHQITKEAVQNFAEYIKIEYPYIDYCRFELSLKSQQLTKAGLRKTLTQYYNADGLDQLNRWLNEKHNYDISFMQLCLADVKNKLQHAAEKQP